MKFNRRFFLRAAGISLALPCFDAWAKPETQNTKYRVA